jgi:hypothetical protein
VTRCPARALLVAALLPASAATAGDKVGPETCKACHPEAYEAWRTGPHARTLESLPERSRKDPRCLSCHAPDREAGIAAVSCEACHGPGRIYSAPYVMRDPELARAVGLLDPGEKTCRACHTESTPSLVRFEHAKKLPLIDHWSKEREARRAAASAVRAPAAGRPSEGRARPRASPRAPQGGR